jgi:probable phosphoglycerate mutase
VRDLLLLRHAQSTWNAEGRWQGQSDPPLSALGEQQILAAAAALPRDLEGIVASDLERARRTAGAAADVLGLPVAIDPRLRERHGGPLEGLTSDELAERYPEYLADRRNVPDGFETDAQLIERVRPALEGLSGRMLVVTHGGVIAAISEAYGHARWHPENTTGCWLRFGAGGRPPALEVWAP